MNPLEEKARRRKRAALWWMTCVGLLTIVIFGYCSDRDFFRWCVNVLSEHRLLECDSSNPCVVAHWRSWEMGAVTWSMLFGIYYFITFTAPDPDSNKLVCLLVILGAEFPNAAAGYFILFRRAIEWHVVLILLATFAFLWADAWLFNKHPDGSDQKGAYFESLLLADAPIVVGSIALLVYLFLQRSFSLDASHSQELDAFAGGAISFQLIASNVIFVVTQGDFFSTFWKKHLEASHERGTSATEGIKEEVSSGSGDKVTANDAEALSSRAPAPHQAVRAWGRVRLMSGLLALIMLTALAIFIFVPMKAAVRELVLVSEIGSGSDRVTALALSADGESLARGSSESGSVKIFAAQSRKGMPESVVLEDETVVHALAFSPDGRTLASAGKGLKVILWNPKTAVRQRALDAEQDFSVSEKELLCLDFSFAGDMLAAGTESGTIKLWDLKMGKKWSLPLTGSEEGARHEGEVRALAFSADGRWLVSGGKDKKIILWNIGALLLGDRIGGEAFGVPTETKALLISVALSSDGNLWAAGTQDAKVWLWDRTIEKVISEPTRFSPMSGHKGAVQALRFSDDASLLASVSENPGLIFWETQSGNSGEPVKAQSKSPTVMTFARNAWILASASSDGTLRVWRGK